MGVGMGDGGWSVRKVMMGGWVWKVGKMKTG